MSPSIQLIPGKLYKIHMSDYSPFCPYSLREPPEKEIVVMVYNIDQEGTITFLWKNRKLRMSKAIKGTPDMYIIEEVEYE